MSIVPIAQSVPGSAVVVAKEYASAVARAEGIIPITYDGPWDDLEGALKACRSDFPDVVCTSTYGKDFPIDKRNLPSFQYTQWLRAGVLDKWGMLPLTIRRPHNASEIANKFITGPTILYGDHSQSSPFPHKEELYALLNDNFGKTHKILRLSEVMLESPMDLLCLYDAADALVTVETIHGHLAKASRVPTIVLATDTPSLWHGTAAHPSYRLHVRYADYSSRRDEIREAVRHGVNKSPTTVIHTLKTLFKNPYNGSIHDHANKLMMAYRWHDSKGMSRLAMAELSKDLKVRRNSPINMPEAIAHYGHEDPRLFTYRGELWMAYVISNMPKTMNCAMAYGRLVNAGGQWRIDSHIQPNFGRNDMTAMEKNWVPVPHGDKLYFIYKSGHTLHVDGANVVREEKFNDPPWAWGEIRGGSTPIPCKGQLLRFFHSRVDRADKGMDKKLSPWWWRYYIGWCLHESQPPFRITKIGSHPLIAGDEEYRHEMKFWKPNCSLAFGAVQRDGKFLVSYGHNDSAVKIAEISESQLV